MYLETLASVGTTPRGRTAFCTGTDDLTGFVKAGFHHRLSTHSTLLLPRSAFARMSFPAQVQQSGLLGDDLVRVSILLLSVSIGATHLQVFLFTC